MHRPSLAPLSPNRVKLFGGTELMTPAGPVTGRAVQRRRLALLALLASARKPARSRDQLVALLWPDADAEHGRKLLSDSIYRINQAVGAEAIVGVGDDVRRKPEVLGTDLEEFEAAAHAGSWRRVADLYSGPFLEGFYLPESAEFDQWMEAERRQHARTTAKALEALANAATKAGNPAEAVEWWERLALLVPDDSRITLALMQALEAAGNTAGALRYARAHARLLRETIGVDPDKAVHDLAEQLSGRRSPPPAWTVTPPKVTMMSSPAKAAAPAAQPARWRWMFAGAAGALAVVLVVASLLPKRPTCGLPYLTNGSLEPFQVDSVNIVHPGLAIPVTMRVTECATGILVNTLAPRISLGLVDPDGVHTRALHSSDQGDSSTTMRAVGNGQYDYSLATLRSPFNGGQDLGPGVYELSVSSPGKIADVIVRFAIRP